MGMALYVTLLRPEIGDVSKVLVNDSSLHQIVTKTMVKQRFGIVGEDNSLVLSVPYDNSRLPFVVLNGVRQWMLEGGKSYVVITIKRERIVQPLVMPKIEVILLSSSFEDTHVHSKIGVSVLPDNEGDKSCPPSLPPTYQISALDKFLGISGCSELAFFRRQETWDVKHGVVLLDTYNGNIVFEFPPVNTLHGRGHFLQGMDREMDCYAWTRIITTLARIHPTNQYTVGKVNCTGALECQNTQCQYLVEKGHCNGFSWIGRPKANRPHKVDKQVSKGDIVCVYYLKRPFCVRSCLAKLFFMYPSSDVDPKMIPFMSRLAIHMGTHDHLARKTFSCVCMKKVSQLIQTEVNANPGATLGRLRNIALGKLVGFLHPETAENLSEEEEKEIWDSLQVISTLAKFAQVMRSVKIV